MHRSEAGEEVRNGHMTLKVSRPERPKSHPREFREEILNSTLKKQVDFFKMKNRSPKKILFLFDETCQRVWDFGTLCTRNLGVDLFAFLNWRTDQHLVEHPVVKFSWTANITDGLPTHPVEWRSGNQQDNFGVRSTRRVNSPFRSLKKVSWETLRRRKSLPAFPRDCLQIE